MVFMVLKWFFSRLFVRIFLFLPLGQVFAGPTEPDDATLREFYQGCLSEHTYLSQKNGLAARFVNYHALSEDPRWATVVSAVATYPSMQLKTREQKLAFYLNAYNILAIDMVIRNWPVTSLRSLGNWMKPVWTHPAGIVAGKLYTLRELEHGVLRKMGEPRIHFAINCASLSCPDLRAEPYEASRIYEQLEEQTRHFLSQENKGFRLSEAGLWLSPLFEWFAADFEGVGGVQAFVLKRHPEWSTYFPVEGFLDYNWNVNASFSAGELRRLRN